MDRKLTREALRLLDAHQPFVRATVVQALGSVPGKLGASMLVREDGSTLGTVGGAALEEKVKELAAAALVRRQGGLHHFDLQRWTEGGLPSLCGGSVEIAIEYVAGAPHLLIWGGGHVAAALAQLLPPLEYDYSIADDRAEWIGPDRFPNAVRRVVTPPSELWERLPPSEFTHLYILGYDAGKDLEVLRRSLDRFPGAIGLIASTSKREHMYAELRRSGITESSLLRIRSPIGLSIGAESPAEIAVSVVAEIVRDRHAPAPALEGAGVAPRVPERHGVGAA
jgi:xanthine dehydrogenase accessory factor